MALCLVEQCITFGIYGISIQLTFNLLFGIQDGSQDPVVGGTGSDRFKMDD